MPPGYNADEQINRYAWEHQGNKRAIQAGEVLGGIVVAMIALVWAWRRRRGARTGRAGEPFGNSVADRARAEPGPTNRKSVRSGQSVSVRVDLGGRRKIKKKKK